MDEVLMSANGVYRQLELLPTKIRIRRKGHTDLTAHEQEGNKEIPIRQISSIRLKKPGPLAYGYIQFAFLGGQKSKRGAAFQAAFRGDSDENTIIFNEKQLLEFEQMKAAIEKEMNSEDETERASRALEDLEKLAALRDRGIVTEEEFAAKKKQLLGL